VRDSGYGSTGELFEFGSAEIQSDSAKVFDLGQLPIPRLRSPTFNATPGNGWFSIGKWAS
jgi:hypothetical protein